MVVNKKIDPKDYEAAFLFNHFLNSCHKRQRLEAMEDHLNAKPFDCREHRGDNSEEGGSGEATSSKAASEGKVMPKFLRKTFQADKKTKNLSKASQTLKIFTDSESHSAPEGRLSFKNNVYPMLSIRKQRPYFITRRDSYFKDQRAAKINGAQFYAKSQNMVTGSNAISYSSVVDAINHNFVRCVERRRMAASKRERSTRGSSQSSRCILDSNWHTLSDSNSSFATEHENSLSSDRVDAKPKLPEDRTKSCTADAQSVLKSNIEEESEAANSLYSECSSVCTEKFAKPSMDGLQNDDEEVFGKENFGGKAEQRVLDLYKPGDFERDSVPLQPGEAPGFICVFCKRRYIKKAELVQHLHEVHAETMIL